MLLEAGKTPLDRLLPADLLTEFQSKIPPKDRDWVIWALRRRARWGADDPANYTDISFLPMRPGFKETNLEHVGGMLEMANEAETYPSLKTAMNFRTIRIMMILHDLGEFRIGDAPNQGEERQRRLWVVRKAYEPQVVRNVIAGISDGGLRSDAGAFYERYEQQSPDDPDALFTKFCDRAQGAARTGATHVFDFRGRGLTQPNMRTIDHVGFSIRKMTESAELFITSLENKNAKTDAAKFVFGEFMRLSKVGYEELVDPRLQYLQDVLKNS